MSDTTIEPAVGALWAHPRAAAQAYGCAVGDVHRDTAMRHEQDPAWLAAITFPSGGSYGLGRYSPLNDLHATARERALGDLHRRGPQVAQRRGLKLVVLVPDVEQQVDRFGCYEWPTAWRVQRVYRAPGDATMVLADGVSPEGGSLLLDGREFDDGEGVLDSVYAVYVDPETGLRDE